MSFLIRLQDIHKRYGPTVIFEGASAAFYRADKVGLIGRNGAGKTTLCKVLLGEEELDAGGLIKSPQLRLSYLEQEDPFDPAEKVMEFLKRYTRKEEWRCGKIAGRFQLKGDVLAARVTDLPGGFQTRVKLVAMLLRDPNFLVLDEPTNYLDLKTQILFERFLEGFGGGYLIVSHDRELLKRTCNKTLELERGRLNLYPGDIEAFLGAKEEQQAHIERHNKSVEAKKRHLQEFVDRHRARAATASRAQSKLKQLARLRTIAVEHPISTARIKIPSVAARRGVALRCSHLDIGYPERTVAKNIRFEIERGERVAILGDNGQGKSTLLRTLAGDLEAKGGAFQWSHGLSQCYYAQHVYAALNSRQNVIEHLELQAARDVMRQEILDMAGSFLFSGDEVHKPISVLSGGERARLCLAGLLLSKRPVFLFDEPTSHLDFETVEALGNALKNYCGTILFTSHDRTFVRLVATSIVEVKDGTVALYPGDYESYVYRAEREVEEDPDVTPETPPAGSRTPKISDYQRAKALRSRINKLKTRIRKVEEQMARFEAEREAIYRHYLENPLDYSKERQARSDELQGLLSENEELWLELQTELEELQGGGEI